EKVEAELERVDATASGINERVTAIEERVFRLAQISLSGEIGAGTDLVIPNDVRGEFRSYLLEVQAGAVGQSNRPLVVRVNGVDEEEYRAQALAWELVP